MALPIDSRSGKYDLQASAEQIDKRLTELERIEKADANSASHTQASALAFENAAAGKFDDHEKRITALEAKTEPAKG